MSGDYVLDIGDWLDDYMWWMLAHSVCILVPRKDVIETFMQLPDYVVQNVLLRENLPLSNTQWRAVRENVRLSLKGQLSRAVILWESENVSQRFELRPFFLSITFAKSRRASSGCHALSDWRKIQTVSPWGCQDCCINQWSYKHQSDIIKFWGVKGNSNPAASSQNF